MKVERLFIEAETHDSAIQIMAAGVRLERSVCRYRGMPERLIQAFDVFDLPTAFKIWLSRALVAMAIGVIAQRLPPRTANSWTNHATPRHLESPTRFHRHHVGCDFLPGNRL
jgi:hypothetical protein